MNKGKIVQVIGPVVDVEFEGRPSPNFTFLHFVRRYRGWLTIGLVLVGVVMFGTVAGSVLPFVLRKLGFDPASASAPFVATLVDVTGLVIYFTVGSIMLRGTLL